MIRRRPVFFLSSALLFIVALSSSSHATIPQSDLKKKVVVTEQAALLQQIDTVSLYLTSSRVALAPRLKGGVIEVEATVLDPILAAKPAKAKEFVSRLIDTFVSTLTERLPIYAPDIAARFDPNKDIRFTVNAGKTRSPIGVWEGGGWQAEALAAAAPAPALPSPQAADAMAGAKAAATEEVATEPPPLSPKGCGCPARR